MNEDLENYINSPWRMDDQTLAMRDGWLIAIPENGKPEIQRVDETAVFDCDEAARLYVKQQAVGPLGDPVCKKALRVLLAAN